MSGIHDREDSSTPRFGSGNVDSLSRLRARRPYVFLGQRLIRGA